MARRVPYLQRIAGHNPINPLKLGLSEHHRTSKWCTTQVRITVLVALSIRAFFHTGKLHASHAPNPQQLFVGISRVLAAC